MRVNPVPTTGEALAAAPCRFCGGGPTVPMVRFDEMAVHRCRSCRAAFVANPPGGRADADDDYSRRYEHELDPAKPARCWELLGRLTDGLSGARSILDVGCGAGAFLDLAAGAGLRTAGIEIAAPAAEAAAAKGHRILHGSIDGDGACDAASYDVVTMWDLLEHLRNPGRALQAAYGMLSAGGTFLAVTPMMDSIFDRVAVVGHRASGSGFERLLRMCWTREHLFRFHPTGVVRVLRRLGFVSIRVTPVLLLSLGAEHYAGGEVLSSWTGHPRLDRAISRAGVFLVKLLGVRNKVLIQASKPAAVADAAPPGRG